MGNNCFSSKTNNYLIKGDNYSSNTEKTCSTSNGERPHHKILVVGQTGAGKSTAINMFVNLINQKSYKDQRKIAITQNVNIANTEILLECNISDFKNKQSDLIGKGPSESQTQNVFIYELHGKTYDISLIDTPGLGDTKGTLTDEKNIRMMVAEIQQLSKITCILYIHKSSEMRENSFLKYYINQLKDLLPVEYRNNFVIGFTFVVNPCRIEAIPVLRKSGIPVDKYVYFENDCLMHPDLIPNIKNTIKNTNQPQTYWNQNAQQFKQLIEMINPMISQNTSILLDLYCKKQTIIQLIFQKQHKIDECQQRKALFSEMLENIVKTKQTLQISTFESFLKLSWQTMKKTRKIKKYIDVELDKKVTICFDCCNVCHKPCHLREIYNQGDVRIKDCKAFGCGSLDKCKKCSHSSEYHGHTMKIQQVGYEDIEIDYEKIEKMQSQAINEITFRNEIDTAINQLTAKEENMKKQIEQKVEEIKRETLFIAVLIKYVNDHNMNFNNQILIDHIHVQIDNTNKSTLLTQDEKQKKQEEHKAQLEYYSSIEKQLQTSKNFNFDNYDQPQLEQLMSKIQQLIDEEVKVVKKRDFFL